MMQALIDFGRGRPGSRFLPLGLAAMLGLAGPDSAAGGGPAPAASPYRLVIDAEPYRLHTGSSDRAKPSGRGRASGWSGLIERHARARGLDPDLVHAVVRAESAYRPAAVSPKGAVGLMQVMPDTGKRFGVVDLHDPDANLRAGTAYLSYLLSRFSDLPLALAAYNAGEGAVVRHGYAVPPYPETRAYVRSVLVAYGGKGMAAQPSAPALPGPRHFYLEGTRFKPENGGSPYRLRLADE